MTKIYAGIGSRSTPADICKLMTQLGEKLAAKGATLRSGKADGADNAFERGCDKVWGAKEIFQTESWYFNDVESSTIRIFRRTYGSKWQDAELIAAQHHPAWQYLKPYARKLHTRNCFQVLGISLLEPAHFVLCWTLDGARTTKETSAATGGTGQAIRVANSYGIRVYNLAVPEDIKLAQSWLSR
jgi:hypothetical protein